MFASFRLNRTAGAVRRSLVAVDRRILAVSLAGAASALLSQRAFDDAPDDKSVCPAATEDNPRRSYGSRIATCERQPAAAHRVDVPTGVVDDAEAEVRDEDTSSWYKSYGKIGTPLFPARQLYTLAALDRERHEKLGASDRGPDAIPPNLAYPHWNENWDGREHLGLPPPAPDDDEDALDDDLRARRRRDRMRSYRSMLRKRGTHRHVILVRHGQYEETDRDETRVLTPLGREQARLTGERLLEMIRGATGESHEGKENDDSVARPVKVKCVRVSTMVRAVETADIISKVFEDNGISSAFQNQDSVREDTVGEVEKRKKGTIRRTPGDPNINEGRPAHTVPGGRVSSSTIQRVDKDHERAEIAFHQYFYRSDPPPSVLNYFRHTPLTTAADADADADLSMNPALPDDEARHEFEIIVCHGNMIRYFFCRLLQLPPEAWLRLTTFNCSLNYFVIRPTGSVSCRTMGDVGHLPYDKTTFSMHHGFNW